MACNKLSLKQLLKEDQEPFQLKDYIAERRSQLKKPVLEIDFRLRKWEVGESSTLSSIPFQDSPDFIQFTPPLKSSPDSPVGGSLRISSGTAGMLAEAALRIQEQQKSRPKTEPKRSGLRVFGSFLKMIKYRTMDKKCATGDDDFTASRRKTRGKVAENERILEASTSNYLEETQISLSPFIFSIRRSPSCSGSQTMSFTSPTDSPAMKMGKEGYDSDSHVKEEDREEEEKEQCSPVSILDDPFEGEGYGSGEEASNLECSYTNVQRAKHQLLTRLRRFEKLAGLDPMELEKNVALSSDDEFEHESVEESEACRHTFMMDTIDSHDRSMKMSPEKVFFSSRKEFVLRKTCTMSGSWKEVELSVDRMIDLDLKINTDEWTRSTEPVTTEMELEIFNMLVEELSGELFSIDG